jgi:hypothetical protein
MNERYQNEYYSPSATVERFLSKGEGMDDLESAYVSSQIDDAVAKARTAINKVSPDRAFMRAAAHKLLDSMR